MAQRAIGGEPGEAMIHRRGAVEILSMAANAFLGCPFKTQIPVAGDTFDSPVRSAEGERGGVVRECRRDGDILPRRRRVAFTAPHGKRAMRRFLCSKGKRPEGEEDKGLIHERDLSSGAG